MSPSCCTSQRTAHAIGSPRGRRCRPRSGWAGGGCSCANTLSNGSQRESVIQAHLLLPARLEHPVACQQLLTSVLPRPPPPMVLLWAPNTAPCPFFRQRSHPPRGMTRHSTLTRRSQTQRSLLPQKCKSPGCNPGLSSRPKPTRWRSVGVSIGRDISGVKPRGVLGTFTHLACAHRSHSK